MTSATARVSKRSDQMALGKRSGTNRDGNHIGHVLVIILHRLDERLNAWWVILAKLLEQVLQRRNGAPMSFESLPARVRARFTRTTTHAQTHAQPHTHNSTSGPVTT
eukprot:6494659-Prymnesium_polylepis.2